MITTSSLGTPDISVPMRDKGQIIFIGDYLFPEGDAAAVRTLSLARICRDLGFAVTVIGKGRLRSEDYDRETGRHRIEGIRYSTMNPKPVSAIQRVRHPVSRMRQSVSALEALNLENARAVIINASGSARHVPFVSTFCRRTIDSTDRRRLRVVRPAPDELRATRSLHTPCSIWSFTAFFLAFDI